MLEVACGVARNKFNHLKKVVGIAMEPPRISQRVSEDFILLECENWSDEQEQYFQEANDVLQFF
jgi:hypothetical protein